MHMLFLPYHCPLDMWRPGKQGGASHLSTSVSHWSNAASLRPDADYCTSPRDSGDWAECRNWTEFRFISLGERKRIL